jgi:homoserine kinase type II
MKFSVSELKQVLTAFDIGKIVSVEPISQGLINHNWVVTSKSGVFIARLANPKRKLRHVLLEQKFALAMSNAIPETGFPLAISTKRGINYVRFEGRILWLYPRLEGNPKRVLNSRNLKELARLLARMHIAAKTFPLKFSRFESSHKTSKLITFLQRQKKAAIRKKAKSRADIFFLSVVDDVISRIRALRWLGYDRLPKVMIHSDAWPSNILFSSNKLTALLDFDDIRCEARVRDLTVVLKDVCRRPNGLLDIAKARLVINEYQKLLPIENQLKFFPALALREEAGSFCHWYDLLSNEPDRNVSLADLKKQYKNIVWYCENSALIIKSLDR